MNADSAYVIGKSHEVCQDYARSGVVDGMAYGIIADGCSSSKDSDVGARLLVLNAERLITTANLSSFPNLRKTVGDIGWNAAGNAIRQVEGLGLESCALDATLLIAVSNGREAALAAFGDGMLILVGPGHTQIDEVEFASGYPCYLSYKMEESRRQQYDLVGGIGRRTRTTWHVGGKTEDSKDMVPHQAAFTLSGPKNGEVFVAAVLSDGVRSFYKRRGDGGSIPIPTDEVLEHLLAFKLPKGRFVQRRMNAFLKQATKMGWEHYDDLSMAAIHLGSR